MKSRDFALAVGLAVSILIIHIVGFFFPSTLTWGFHQFGFLPPLFLLGYLVLGAGVILAARSGLADAVTQGTSSYMEKNPYQFLVTSVGIFVLSAILLKVRAPLLGDSFFLVRNFSDALHNPDALLYRNEPLATYYYFVIVRLFAPATFTGFLNAFLVADIVLGIGFIVATFFLVRELIPDIQIRFGVFCLLMFVPYMQLFFGYVETYGFVLLVLSLYILVAVLALRDKLSFVFVPVMAVLAIASHYLALLLLPSVCYGAYIQWKAGRRSNVLAAVLAAAVLSFALLVIANFDFTKYSAAVPHSHFLPLIVPTDPDEILSTPYTLLSPYHLSDLVNALLLLYTPAIFIFFLTVGKWTREIWREQIFRFLVFAIAPVFLFLFVVKFDLGAVKDWDVLSPYAFVGILLSAVALSRSALENRTSILSLILGIGMLNTIGYTYLNSTTDGALHRYRSILDSRTLSEASYYTAALHLAQYYHQEQDTTSPAILWEQYMRDHPEDPRGYQNLIQNLQHGGPERFEKISEVYERWLAVNPTDTLAHEAFARVCLDAGNDRYTNGMYSPAKTYYERAISLDPTLDHAYNNLGSICAQEGDRERAIELFNQAIELDSTYSDAYYNLGSVYEDQGDKKKAMEFKKRAARLGNAAAQTVLQQQGISWK
ncbi:MAG TPA: tetratricopeptide repeat protein [Bacteroidota bacterium]|nr:tetratricopeptide repeat protein [Bacteroidota bacterium]